MKKVVVYINQFFGQIGGEDKADFPPEIKEGAIGAAQLLDILINAEVTHTIICGDNFISSHPEEAINTICKGLENIEFDLFIAGPAFQAGRYGIACGQVCKAVKEQFKVPVLTSMHRENPGVTMFKREFYILEGSNRAARMRKDLEKLVMLANKILNEEPINGAEAEGYFKRGVRHQVWPENGKRAAERVVEMFLRKIRGEVFQTEMPIPQISRVAIAPVIKSLKDATIALVTSGGIVPVDNPDRIQSASATRWGRYDISDVDDVMPGVYKTIHAGFDPTAADAAPHVIAPVDALKAYVKEGKIAKLHPYLYSTVGTGTTEAEATRMAQEMLPFLNEDQVDGVILVST